MWLLLVVAVVSAFAWSSDPPAKKISVRVEDRPISSTVDNPVGGGINRLLDS